MERFTRITSVAAPVMQANIDTDIIFPARFLLVTAKAGLGEFAFYDWRQHSDRTEDTFVLDREPYRNAKILVAGSNFGCGSSREQAPWALRDLGIRCIISTSFGEIFYSNCFKNGMLPVVVTQADIEHLGRQAEAACPLTVDLQAQCICDADEGSIFFAIEGWRREALLCGWDEIAIVLNSNVAEIATFERRQRDDKPWLQA